MIETAIHHGVSVNLCGAIKVFRKDRFLVATKSVASLKWDVRTRLLDALHGR
jgi:hypothetical protein